MRRPFRNSNQSTTCPANAMFFDEDDSKCEVNSGTAAVPYCFPSSRVVPLNVALLGVLISLLILLLRWLYRGFVLPPRRSTLHKCWERKCDFLQRVGDQYGYRLAPASHIDSWRKDELPGLISPLKVQKQSSILDTIARLKRPVVVNMTALYSEEELNDDDDDTLPQVYLDFAGAALPTRSQLDAIHRSNVSTILANPHSTGPAASKTMHYMEQAKKIILDHFHAHPGRFAGMSPFSDDAHNNNQLPKTAAASTRDVHPGYEIIFTSGATEALRIVAEYFPWSGGSNDGVPDCSVCHGIHPNVSTLLYSHNAHTSVLGMRGPALAKGAKFSCKRLDELVQTDLSDEIILGCCSHHHTSQDVVVHNLLVLPTECNFGGDRPRVDAIFANIEKANHHQYENNSSQRKSKWWTLLDISKAASTGPISLCDLNPDFACISFYKLFGEPTGLGALFIKRTAAPILVAALPHHHQHATTSSNSSSLHRYFGGGSVDAVLAGVDFAIPRTSPSSLATLTQGTMHFRGIASLRHGFAQLNRLGGMEAIRQHTTCLTVELVRRFRRLRHGNGTPAIRIYGAWSQQSLDTNVSLLSFPGPTVAFNVLREDGSFVGYHDVSKLASLHQPPLQLRTGCFCNPGACQAALGLTDEEIQTNYQISGHVCGDDIDIIQNKPTGAVRVSFGKDSIWEDLDVLVTFLESTFVSQHSAEESRSSVSVDKNKFIQPIMATLTELYIFPIKSCAAQRVYRWQMDGRSGRLAFDREFALVDSSGTAMRLQTHPKMSLVRPVIDVIARRMTISAPDCNNLILQLDHDGNDNDASDKELQQQHCKSSSLIQVCGNKCGGQLWGDYHVSEWFSSFLGVQCWLARYDSKGNCYIPPNKRELTPGILTRSNQVAFANEQPLLLISEHSVSALNHTLLRQGQQAARTLHFRPNLVIRYAPSSLFETTEEDRPMEDEMSTVLVQEKNIKLTVVGKCARCAMVDFDPGSGRKGRTLRALADVQRRSKGPITFGVFLQSDASSNAVDVVWMEEGEKMLCR